MIIKLPNGLLDGADLFNLAEIDELRGKQQNYLVDKDLIVGNIGHVPKLLEDMLKSLQTEQGLAWKGNIKDALEKLSVGDLETILIKVRENTFGPKFYYDAKCSHCEALNKDLRLDLDSLELDIMTLPDMLDSEKRKITLPKSNKVVEFKPLYMKDLFKLIKITDKNTSTIVTSSISLFIKSIDGNPNITEKDIENLSAVDIQFLNDKAQEIKFEGSIDTNIITECNKCSKEFETKLNVYDPSFFAPSKGFRTTNI